MFRPFVSAFAGVLLAVLVAGCGSDRHSAYIKANEQLFKQLPRFPGAQLMRERSSAYYGASDLSPVRGYTTVYEFRFPTEASGASVGAFFEQRLQPRWLLFERLAGSPFGGGVSNFRWGSAEVSINLENGRFHRFEIDLDHAFFGKLGRCGLPGGCNGSPAWVAIRKAILACRAKAVGQTHSRDVVVTLKDGRTLAAKEPRIDAVGAILNAVHCEPPPAYATE